jgi:hypothetical protein
MGLLRFIGRVFVALATVTFLVLCVIPIAAYWAFTFIMRNPEATDCLRDIYRNGFVKVPPSVTFRCFDGGQKPTQADWNKAPKRRKTRKI